jgi:hypothetical protein
MPAPANHATPPGLKIEDDYSDATLADIFLGGKNFKLIRCICFFLFINDTVYCAFPGYPGDRFYQKDEVFMLYRKRHIYSTNNISSKKSTAIILHA